MSTATPTLEPGIETDAGLAELTEDLEALDFELSCYACDCSPDFLEHSLPCFHGYIPLCSEHMFKEMARWNERTQFDIAICRTCKGVMTDIKFVPITPTK